MLSNNNGTMTFNNFSNITKIPSQVFTYLIKNKTDNAENFWSVTILLNNINTYIDIFREDKRYRSYFFNRTSNSMDRNIYFTVKMDVE